MNTIISNRTPVESTFKPTHEPMRRGAMWNVGDNDVWTIVTHKAMPTPSGKVLVIAVLCNGTECREIAASRIARALKHTDYVGKDIRVRVVSEEERVCGAGRYMRKEFEITPIN